MDKECKLSRELQDSIREATDKKTVLCAMHQINLEVKPEKYESRILALNSCRFFLYTAKVPFKLELSSHFLDIHSIESLKPSQLRLTLSEGKQLYFTAVDADATGVDAIITHIGDALCFTFPLLSVEKLILKLDVAPPTRMKQLVHANVSADIEAAVTIKDTGLCDGFSRVYASMCDYHGCTVMDEIVWDFDTIYASQDLRTLRLQEFDHLSPRDHVPLISALQFSSWFTSFDATNMKLTNEALVEVLKVLKKSSSLTHFNLAGTGLKFEYAQKLSTALISNVATALVSLNLADNIIDDRGVGHLCGVIAKLPLGMHHLNLASTGLTAKGVNRLGETLAQSRSTCNSLLTLDLSGNALKMEDLSGLHTFLSQSNVLRELNMANTESPVDTLVGALSKGCLIHLERLNVASNPFSAKKTKEPPQSWKQFFSSVHALKQVNLASTKLPPAALKALLLGLSVNPISLLVDLGLASNELRADGANVIGGCVAELKNVLSLDLADNELDASLSEVLPWFGHNGTIRHLSVGKNFATLKSKQLAGTLDSLVCLMQTDDLALRSLSIADSKLKFDTTVVINALGSNTTIEKLDISGNQMGDVGAKMLAKALAINTSLTAIVWDKNNVSAVGLEDVAAALERNYSLLTMPLPVHDVSNAAKVHPERVQASVEKIQLCLQRNHGSLKIPVDQSYRLHQSFLTSSMHKMTGEYVGKLRESLNAFKPTQDGGTLSPSAAHLSSQLELALRDAENVRQVMAKLQSVAARTEAVPNRISEHLGKLSKDLQAALDEQLEVTIKEMLKAAKADCPYVFESDPSIFEQLAGACRKQGHSSEELVSSLVKQQLEASVDTKLSHKNFDMAAFIADSVVDKLLEDLVRMDKDAQLCIKQNPVHELKVEVVSENLVESADGTDDAFVLVDKQLVAPGAESTRDKVSAPAQPMRKSMLNERKRRPQSLLESGLHLHAVEIDLDEVTGQGDVGGGPSAAVATSSSSSDVPSDVVDTVVRCATEAPIDFDVLTMVGELQPQLVHATKNRPKRPRVHMPGHRPLASTSGRASADGDNEEVEENDVGGLPDDGVDRFFEPLLTLSMTSSVTSADSVKGRNKSPAAAMTSAAVRLGGDSPQQKKKFWPFGGSIKDKEKDKEAKEKDKEAKEKDREAKEKDKETKEKEAKEKDKEAKEKDTKEKKSSFTNLFGFKKEKDKDKKLDADKSAVDAPDTKPTNEVSVAAAASRPQLLAKRTPAVVKDIPEKHDAEMRATVPLVDPKTTSAAGGTEKAPLIVRGIPELTQRPESNADSSVHSLERGKSIRDVGDDSAKKVGEDDRGTEGASKEDAKNVTPPFTSRKPAGHATLPGMTAAMQGSLMAEMKAKRQTVATPLESSTPPVAPKVALRPPVAVEAKLEGRGGKESPTLDTAAAVETDVITSPSVKTLSPICSTTALRSSALGTSEKPALPVAAKPASGAAVAPPRPAAPPKPQPKPKPGSRPSTLDASQLLDAGVEEAVAVPADGAVDKPAEEERSCLAEPVLASEKPKEAHALDSLQSHALPADAPLAASASPVPLLRRHKRGESEKAVIAAGVGDKPGTPSPASSSSSASLSSASLASPAAASGGSGSGESPARAVSLRRSLVRASGEQSQLSSSPPSAAAHLAAAGAALRSSRTLSSSSFGPSDKPSSGSPSQLPASSDSTSGDGHAGLQQATD